MLTTILFSFFLLSNCYENPEELLISFDIAGADTVQMGNFNGEICYRYYGDYRIDFILNIFKGDEPVFKTGDYQIELYNFSADSARPVYTKDMDGDGIDEFILHCNGGGQQCCNEVRVFGLYDEPILKDSVYNWSPRLKLKDIDNDGIPEINCSENHFRGWKAHPAESPVLSLIWKWDGEKYRLANFKFGEYLLNRRSKWRSKGIPLPDSLEGLRYDPDSDEPDFPPVALWGRMLKYIYAGQATRADSIFNEYWPDEIPGKKEFYRDFKAYLQRSGHWQQLQDSDW